jgi:hypothetical protein
VWVQAGELQQVAGHGAADVVDAGFLGCDALGFLECAQCFADLAAHGVCLGQVVQVPGLPLGGEAGGADLLGQVDGLPGVAEFHRDVNGVDGDVGGTELGAVVVVVLAEPLGDLLCGVEIGVGLAALVVSGGGDILPANPIDKVAWKAPEVAGEVDRRVVVRPRRVRAPLAAVEQIAPELTAFFGCLYYACMRPGEADSARLTA